MNMMERKAEHPPALTGMDLVLKENLYANLRLPQQDLAIMTFTLNALLSDANPKELIKKYLASPLPEEQAAHMIERANRAHAAFRPKEKQFKLSLESLQGLWREEQKGMGGFFYHVFKELALRDSRLGGPGPIDELLDRIPLPLETLRACMGAAVARLKSKEVAPLLEEYRNSFREDKEGNKLEQARLYKEITNEVVWSLRKVDGEHIDRKIRDLVINIFEIRAGSEL